MGLERTPIARWFSGWHPDPNHEKTYGLVYAPLDEANRTLTVIESELAESNQSAAQSFREGKEETLTLHSVP